MNEEEKGQVNVHFVMEHMSRNNKRLLVALLAVCVTFILTIIIFVHGYTIREKNWLDTLQRVGVADGIHEQSSEGAH